MSPRRQPKHKDSKRWCRPKSFPTRPVNPKQFHSLASERPIGSETVPPRLFVDCLLSASPVCINRLAFSAWWIMTTEMVLWLRVSRHCWMINTMAAGVVIIRLLPLFPCLRLSYAPSSIIFFTLEMPAERGPRCWITDILPQRINTLAQNSRVVLTLRPTAALACILPLWGCFSLLRCRFDIFSVQAQSETPWIIERLWNLPSFPQIIRFHPLWSI